MTSQTLRISIATVMAVSASTLLGAPVTEPLSVEALTLHSGVHDGNGSDTAIAYAELVEVSAAPWVQITFDDWNLGEESFVTLTSTLTGETQPLDADGMDVWRNTSARLRGDLVEIQLHVAPNDTGVFVSVDSVTTPDPSIWGEPVEGTVATLCGADNRAPSNDSRVGRINGCTAWLVSTGVVLTAGHCLNNAGNLTGSMEFNVPISNSNGATNPATLSNTYPIINNSWTWQDAGIGDDWMIFRIGPSADGTGKNAHASQGFFHMTSLVPAADTTMRVTGYGLDNTPVGTGGAGAACCDTDGDNSCNNNCNMNSRTLQTSTGRFDARDGDILEYEVDTMPANSGSPIINNSTGFAVGLHTAGGCGDIWSGDENHGTWFGDSALANALGNYVGNNAVFVDAANVSLFGLGLALVPFRSVEQAVGAVSNNGTVLIAAGNYRAANGNTFTAGSGYKAMTLRSNTGLVTIGN